MLLDTLVEVTAGMHDGGTARFSGLLVLILVLSCPTLVPGQGAPARADASGEPVATFSIVGYDPETGEAGVAVQSRVFSVGNGVIWGEAGVGVVATQAWVDVSYGPQAIELLRQGVEPKEIVERLLKADPDPFPDDWPKAGRQFSVMNARGQFATHTGGARQRLGRPQTRKTHLSAGEHPGGPRSRRRDGRSVHEHGGSPVFPATGRIGSRTGRRRRPERHAVGRHAGSCRKMVVSG